MGKGWTSGLAGHVDRFRDRTLLEGAMATGALVAMADRRLRLEESLAVGDVLENVEALRMHDPSLAVSIYTGFVERLKRDFEAGKRDALDVVGRCADDIEGAEILVRVGIAIAKADQEFSPEEVEVVQEICGRLGIRGLDPVALAGPTNARRPH